MRSGGFFDIESKKGEIIKLNESLQDENIWSDREKSLSISKQKSVLEKELEVLKEEARGHQEFLDRLRRNPDFQDEVAKKELGYGKPDEWLYRFPPENEN